MLHSRRITRRQTLGWLSAATLALGAWTPAQADTKSLQVVASFSVLGDIVQQIGGADVDVKTLVGRNGDAHGFEPTPRDARQLGQAQLLFINGLGFEAWLPRLQQASGFKGTLVEVSHGIKVRAFDGHAADHHEDDHKGHDGHADHDKPDDHDKHDHDKADVDAKHADAGRPEQAGGHAEHGGHEHGHDHGPNDPHAWQSLANGAIYARNVADALIKADPAHADAYRMRADAYIARINALDKTMKAEFAAVTPERRRVVSSHDAFGYFGDAYGMTFIPVSGISTSAEPSAADLARIIEQVRKEHVSAVFVENISSPRLAEQIARETGAKLGGKLYSDALSAEGEPAGTYLGMFEWNARQLLGALQ